MENISKYCSFKEHKSIEAISYCFKCQIYLCNKCLNIHKGFYDNHPVFNLDKIKEETFTGFCQEKNHNIALQYYCKNHNKLCCGLCTSKIEGKGNGQHNNCDICFIENIKEEKKNKLKDNIKSLEELSNKIEEAIKNLKSIFDKITENKENLKLEIQKVFTKIRTDLNDREDILLSEVDKYFDNNYFNEGLIKKRDKLPIKIKISLEKGKLIENEWNNNDKLNSIINDCINIENNLKDIKIINEKIEKFNKNDKINLKFINNTDNIFSEIKNFGCLTSLSNYDSLILKNENILFKFIKLIGNDKITNKMNLLYRSTRDGFNYLSIVNKINNKSNLLFLYLTGKDRIFGAFIQTKLENIGPKNDSTQFFKDENAFAFSLNNNKKYKILVPENAIGFNNKYYVLIGNSGVWNGFYYWENVIYDKDLITKLKIYDFSKNSELTEGSGNLTELEIFETNFN